jgi:nicotinate-nucleotide--dimethylbenzimidazole phosphoribosyltransferase
LAAAAVLHAVDPAAIAHVMAGDRWSGAGYGRLLHRLGLDPIVDLGMAGEGCGAASAIAIVRLACALA